MGRVHQYCTLVAKCTFLMGMANGLHQMRHCRTMALSSSRQGQGRLHIRSSAPLVRLASSCLCFAFSSIFIHPLDTASLVITWCHAVADDRPAEVDSDAEEVRRLNFRIRTAKQQADALEEMLRQLQTARSGEKGAQGGNAAALRRATLAVEYCNARLARLQAAKDAIDGGEQSAAAAEGASGARQAEL